MTPPSHSQPYAYVFRPLHPKIPWTRIEQSEPLSELHTKYWGKSIQGNEFELQMPMDCGEDQSEVGPGCFNLNLDIESLETQRPWVRMDYLRAYDYCNFHYDEVLKSQLQWGPKTAPSVVITGQPGIGQCFSSLRPSIPNTLL
jgi:hypothetical protein